MWNRERTADGSWTLRHEALGEACHSSSGAWQQALERYAVPCRLRELAHERGAVRLLDIGTGLGLNLAAACAVLEGTGAVLHATSFEVDATVIRTALELRDWPAAVEVHLARLRPVLTAALATPGQSVAFDSGSLKLVLGDARATLAQLADQRFDAVFLDPFSPRVDPHLWHAQFLADIAAHMEAWAVLSTYSASLQVRAGLARAGLRIGRGPRVGAKADGTLASFARTLPALDPRTARKLARRSTAH